ncbi:MAG: hypothetical protein UX09_C0017G0010 [Candidatus Uhrbacteria bacterium GW2011_GWE2_45_35]|uniref:Uncharacterized protein n=2 Tax=Candidatus Uhriibacteriota TaxID=1752732 RepID=A0A0G1LS38_9BACT|nr:MAG: hypothetical protein UW63_C0011G0008 [Candidatus Uhrbacteria bacterium GW2011_GWF2_44_350]KKU08452.1 MAG: hypothetical protein UX09_C0017G0010 [Candidatus Uhrbacteria bacterium GW2011_GWE2_45_35]
MNKNFVIFIDWYGTLNTNLFWEDLLSKPEMKAAQQRLIGSERNIFDDWMRGKYSSEEINRLMAEWAGLPYDLLWSEFVSSCQSMTFGESLKEAIAGLRLEAYVVLATGNMDCFRKFIVPALRLEEVFDRIVVSSDLGFLKTEKNGDFFTTVLSELGVPIERAVLIEDSEKSCSFFRSLGGLAYQVKNKDETISAIENLRQSVKLSS